MRRQRRVYNLILAALGIALLAAAAQIQLPIGLVPFTLQTLVLFIIVLVLNPSAAVAAVAGYLVLGAIGLPVGAGFKGGIAWLIGPTGGFLIGFLLSTVLVSLLRQFSLRRFWQNREKSKRQELLVDLSLSLLLIVIYDICGWLWFMVFTGSPSPIAAFSVSVAPFLLPDLLKFIVAIPVVHAVRAALGDANWHVSNKD